MSRAVVTGGGGFVGRALVLKLLSFGITVRVVGRANYPDLQASGVEVCTGDIRNKDFL